MIPRYSIVVYARTASPHDGPDFPDSEVRLYPSPDITEDEWHRAGEAFAAVMFSEESHRG